MHVKSKMHALASPDCSVVKANGWETRWEGGGGSPRWMGPLLQGTCVNGYPTVAFLTPLSRFLRVPDPSGRSFPCGPFTGPSGLISNLLSVLLLPLLAGWSSGDRRPWDRKK